MRLRFSFGLRLGVAALLACSAGWASAHTSVSVGVNLGFPGYGSYVAGLPVGAVSVGYYGGYRYWHYGGVWYRPWGPRWVVVAPPIGYVDAPYYAPAPVVVTEPPPVSVAPTKPDPIIYPRNGQDAARTEADRQECNRWATTQPNAVADASVFQRAVEACMDGRGYTMR